MLCIRVSRLSEGENPTSTLCRSWLYESSGFTVEVNLDRVSPSTIDPVLSVLTF